MYFKKIKFKPLAPTHFAQEFSYLFFLLLFYTAHKIMRDTKVDEDMSEIEK